MSATCKLGLLALQIIFGVFIKHGISPAVAERPERYEREETPKDEEILACQDTDTGKISYRAVADAAGDSSCRKFSPTSGTFNQVRDFDGYRASLKAESEGSSPRDRVRRKGDADSDSTGPEGGERGRAALTSFESDELQSKRNPKKFQCHVEGETKVNKGCRVEIELIRGALTTVSFSRLGRSSSNTVKWKRVLEGECRDLTVRAVVSGCE